MTLVERHLAKAVAFLLEPSFLLLLLLIWVFPAKNMLS
jgi:hypothetical protein